MSWFTVAEFRDRYPDLLEAKWPDEKVEEYRAIAEESIELAIGIAYVPREATINSSLGGTEIALAHRKVRRIMSATGAGDELDVTDSAVLHGDTAYIPGGWTAPATITYEHGLDQPPLRGKQAAMVLTKAWMVQGPIDARATQQINVETGGTVNLATPGMFGSTFGIPEVDAFVAAEKRRHGHGIGVL